MNEIIKKYELIDVQDDYNGNRKVYRIKALRDCSISQLENSRNKLTELEYMRAEHIVNDILDISRLNEHKLSQVFILI